MSKSISALVMEYFVAHPNEELRHGPVVDWVTKQWRKEHKEPPRDPWRAIRKLHQEGVLIKVDKGVYKYDPDAVTARELEDFTSEPKKEIFQKDGYRCVLCGRGREDGYEIHADHRIPKELGGKAEISNGQTLCSIHNFRKKTYKQTETGKKYFIGIFESAKAANDQELMEFCKQVLAVYERLGINDHIRWKL